MEGQVSRDWEAQQEVADAQWTWKCPAGAQQEIMEVEPKCSAQRILAEEQKPSNNGSQPVSKLIVIPRRLSRAPQFFFFFFCKFFVKLWTWSSGIRLLLMGCHWYPQAGEVWSNWSYIFIEEWNREMWHWLALRWQENAYQKLKGWQSYYIEAKHLSNFFHMVSKEAGRTTQSTPLRGWKTKF